MKLSKFIEICRRVLQEKGDLEVILALDPEGNSLNAVESENCFSFLMQNDDDDLYSCEAKYSYDERNEELYGTEDVTLFKATHVAIYPG